MNEIVVHSLEIIFGIWLINFSSEFFLGIDILEKISILLNRLIFEKTKTDEKNKNRKC